MSEARRLNKYLADSGVCSRREADRLIDQGRVTVNGTRASMGQKVSPEDEVRLDGETVLSAEPLFMLAFNKPLGIVCTTDPNEPDNVVDYISYPKRIFPIGRLDKYSEGLLLLTNRGDIVNGMMRSRHGHEKEYEVLIDHPVTDEFLDRMRSGMVLDDGMSTRPCIAEKISARKFRIILTQGMNRQIRRMCDVAGVRVMALKRMRVMNILLGDLPVGKYRKLTDDEVAEIERMIGDERD